MVLTSPMVEWEVQWEEDMKCHTTAMQDGQHLLAVVQALVPVGLEEVCVAPEAWVHEVDLTSQEEVENFLLHVAEEAAQHPTEMPYGKLKKVKTLSRNI